MVAQNLADIKTGEDLATSTLTVSADNSAALRDLEKSLKAKHDDEIASIQKRFDADLA